MEKARLMRRIIVGGIVLGVLVVAFGVAQVLQASNRLSELEAIPLQPLIDTAAENPTNATTLAMLERQRKDVVIWRSQALSIIGGGAVLLGIVGFVYTRLPESAAPPYARGSAEPMEG